MIRPLVKMTSSRICIIPSQPARFTAGPTNLEQMSRSLRSFLFMWLSVYVPFKRRQCFHDPVEFRRIPEYHESHIPVVPFQCRNAVLNRHKPEASGTREIVVSP